MTPDPLVASLLRLRFCLSELSSAVDTVLGVLPGDTPATGAPAPVPSSYEIAPLCVECSARVEDGASLLCSACTAMLSGDASVVCTVDDLPASPASTNPLSDELKWFAKVAMDPEHTPAPMKTCVGDFYLSDVAASASLPGFLQQVRLPVVLEAFQFAARNIQSDKSMTPASRKMATTLIQRAITTGRGSSLGLNHFKVAEILSGGRGVGEWTVGEYLTLYRWSRNPGWDEVLVSIASWWTDSLRRTVAELEYERESLAPVLFDVALADAHMADLSLRGRIPEAVL